MHPLIFDSQLNFNKNIFIFVFFIYRNIYICSAIDVIDSLNEHDFLTKPNKRESI